MIRNLLIIAGVTAAITSIWPSIEAGLDPQAQGLLGAASSTVSEFTSKSLDQVKAGAKSEFNKLDFSGLGTPGAGGLKPLPQTSGKPTPNPARAGKVAPNTQPAVISLGAATATQSTLNRPVSLRCDGNAGLTAHISHPSFSEQLTLVGGPLAIKDSDLISQSSTFFMSWSDVGNLGLEWTAQFGPDFVRYKLDKAQNFIQNCKG